MTQDNEDKTIVVSGGSLSPGDGQPSQQVISAPKAKLVCTDASQVDGTPETLEFTLEKEAELVVGRDEGCSACIRSRRLSRKHARIFAGAGAWGIEDLHSTNGVFVNGQRVTTAWLRHGDEVRFGPIAFSFALDRPDVGASAAAPSQPAPGTGEEDAGEKTMMFGSREASEAVLSAMRAPEPPVEEKVATTVASRREFAEERGRGGGGAGKFAKVAAALLVVLGIVGGGGWYYMQGSAAREVEAAVGQGNRLAKRAIEAVRERTAADLLSASYAENGAVLAAQLAALEALAAGNPGHVDLVNTAAKLAFLHFERAFLPLYTAGQVNQAEELVTQTRNRIEALGNKLPSGVREAQIAEFHTARELLDFAGILLQFRRFAVEHPQVGDGAAVPDPQRIRRLFDLKGDYSSYRRSQNKAISVFFILFRTAVNDVEEHAIPLVNRWREQLDR